MEGYSIALLPAKIENGSANENEATLYPCFVCLFFMYSVYNHGNYWQCYIFVGM